MTNYYRHIASGNLWKEVPKTYPFTSDIGVLLELIGSNKKQAFFKTLNDFQPIRNSEDVHNYFTAPTNQESLKKINELEEQNVENVAAIYVLLSENKKLKEEISTKAEIIYGANIENTRYLAALDRLKQYFNAPHKEHYLPDLEYVNRVIGDVFLFNKVTQEQLQDLPLTQDFVVDSYVEDGIEMSADKARKITNTKSNIEGLWKEIDERIEINATFGLNEVGTMLATKYAHNTILRYRNRGFVVNYSDNKLRISW